MKKYIIVLIGLFIFTFSYGGGVRSLPVDTYGSIDYTTWDWENQNIENWEVYRKNIAGQITWERVYPPFTDAAAKVDLMSTIYENEDWTREKGWRLVYVRLADYYPHFILYNIYSGILRAFMFVESTETATFTHLALSITPEGEGKNFKTFSYGAPLLVAVEDTKTDSDSHITIFSNAGPGQWAVFETPILFDNKLQNSTADFKFQFFSCDKFNLQFEINGSAVPSGGNTIVSHSGSLGEKQTFKAIGSKIHTPVKDIADWADKIVKESAKIGKSDSNKIPQFIKNFGTKIGALGNVAKIAGIVSGATAGLEAVLGLFDMFSGGSSSAAPVAYSISLAGTGTVDIERKLPGNQIRIPGCYTTVDDKLKPKAWEYDCAMGLFNLKKTPILLKSKKNNNVLLIGDRFTTLADEFYPKITEVLNDNTPALRASDHQRYKECYFFQLKEGIELNKRDDVDILDIKLALLVKEGNSTNMLETQYWDRKNSGNKKTNIVYSSLERGFYTTYKYEITGSDPDLNEYAQPGIFEYGTPYMPENQISGCGIFALRVYEKKNGSEKSNQEISLGAIIKYKFKGDLSNQVRIFKGKFMCSIEEVENDKLYKEDKLIHTSEIKISTLSTQQYAAHTIIMTPGFIGQNGFMAKGRYNLTENAPARINSFLYGCNNTGIPRLGSTRSEAIINDVTSLEQEVLTVDKTVSLYPNPTDGILNLNCSDADAVCTVKIYTMSGSLVYTNDRLQSGDIIDLIAQARGVYMARIVVDGEVKTEKVILK